MLDKSQKVVTVPVAGLGLLLWNAAELFRSILVEDGVHLVSGGGIAMHQRLVHQCRKKGQAGAGHLLGALPLKSNSIAVQMYP